VWYKLSDEIVQDPNPILGPNTDAMKYKLMGPLTTRGIDPKKEKFKN
jgi:hypothetical protein